MGLAATEARGLFTKMLVDVYQERIKPKSFLRSFFPVVTAPTRYVSIEVERGTETVAVDVLRGSEGNRNRFSRSTEKIFDPPLYREFFDATELDLYDRVLGSQGTDNTNLFVALMNKVADKLSLLQDKIDRAFELQCAQVFEYGIVQVETANADIDYKRKAASLVDDGSGQYFADNIDPFAKFEAGCIFMRTVGKAGDSEFNALMGSDTLVDLLANTKFKERQNLFNMALDQVHGPQRGATGMNLNGIITAGAYKVRLWTYPEYYDLGGPGGTSTPYLNPKKITMIPSNPRFKMAHGAVPQLIDEPGQMPTQGAYVVGNFRDKRKATDEFDIQSCALAIPVAVDQIYTFRAKAA